jgi:hypothetical protein
MEVEYRDVDDTLDAPCLRHYRSEPDFNKVWTSIAGIKNSRIMRDEFYFHVQSFRDDKASPTDAGSQCSTQLDSEPQDQVPPSEMLLLENAPLDGEDEFSIEANDAYTCGPVTYKKSRPCKSQRRRYRNAMARLSMEIEQNPDFIIQDAILPAWCANDDARKKRIEERLQAYKESRFKQYS